MDIAKSTLLIDTRRLEKLAMDGPALSIHLHEQSVRLFPLRRLARIHVMGELQQGFDALMHCAEQQIPVAFFSNKGKLRCQLYFPLANNGILAHWLDHVEFDAEVQEEYRQWLELQRLHTLSQLNLRQVNMNHARLEQELRTRAIQLLHSKKLCHDAIDWLEGFLLTHLSQLVAAHGLGNNCRAARRLLDDIQPLFIITLLHALVHALQQRQRLHINAIGMSDFYHRYSEDIIYNVQRMLTQLASRLEALV